jgi:hypothetical protein
MDSVTPDNVVKECEKIIERHPTGPYVDINNVCLHDYQHSDQCLIGMEHWSQPCIRVDAKKAEQRRNKLLFLSLLKDCARDPAKVNGLHTLEGLAQETCIYDIRYLLAPSSLYFSPSPSLAPLYIYTLLGATVC